MVESCARTKGKGFREMPNTNSFDEEGKELFFERYTEIYLRDVRLKKDIEINSQSHS